MGRPTIDRLSRRWFRPAVNVIEFDSWTSKSKLEEGNPGKCEDGAATSDKGNETHFKVTMFSSVEVGQIGRAHV